MTVTVRLFILVLFALLLLSCSSDSESPEVQIKQVINAMQVQIEARNRRAFSKHVADSFTGSDGMDKEALNNLVRFHILRNQSIQIVPFVNRIESITPTEYRVEMTVFMGSKALNFQSETVRLSADKKQITAYFSKSSGSSGWRLTAASWN